MSTWLSVTILFLYFVVVIKLLARRARHKQQED